MAKIVAIHNAGHTETEQRKMLFLVGAGLIGGVFFGRLFVREFFVEGLTEETRNNILKASAVFLTAWGAKELFQLDKEWWFSAEGLAEKAKTEIAP